MRLVELAYTRVEMVTARGEFAVRGGIVDIFPPTAEHPVRVEFWGDEVSELRAFTVADQRSTHPVDELDAPGCRELLLTDPVRERAAALGRTHENNPPLRELLEHLAQGIPAEGMESLIPALVGAELQLLTDLLPAGAPVLVADPERVRTRSADLVRTGQEFLEASWFAAGMGGGAPIDVGASAYRDLVDVLEHATATGHPVVTLSPLLSGRDDALVAGAARGRRPTAATSTARSSTSAPTSPPVAPPCSWSAATAPRSARWSSSARPTCPPCSPTSCRTSRRRAWSPSPAGGSWRASHRGRARRAHRGRPHRQPRGDHRDPQARLAAAQRRRPGHAASPATTSCTPSTASASSSRCAQRTVQGATREYLVLEYASSKRGQPADRLFVPTDALDEVSRYVGGEVPTLNKLGGADWAKTKGRARKAVRQIAAQLVQLYAARQAAPGYAFAKDTPWQRELEDAFPYTETPDQLAAIDEVKADMERPVPMDRVISGDVGFGKTEIAVRAAFKAVQDGKQVAVLVPTTLLASSTWRRSPIGCARSPSP